MTATPKNPGDEESTDLSPEQEQQQQQQQQQSSEGGGATRGPGFADIDDGDEGGQGGP